MGVVLSVNGEAVEGRNMGMTVHLIDLTRYIYDVLLRFTPFYFISKILPLLFGIV